MKLSLQFLKAVLGDDGAAALQKAAERSVELGNALIPRTIMAWVDVAGRFGFEGELPGVKNTYIHFEKNESGGYRGAISVNDETYNFQDSTLFRLSASVAVALDVSVGDASRIRDMDVEKLGKSVDCLVKARYVAKKLAEESKEESPEELEKAGGGAGGGAKGAEAPGGAAVPKTPEAPTAATAKQPKPKMTGIPKPPKLKVPKPVPSHTLKLAQCEKLVECPVCGHAQFEHGTFRGCSCFRGLAKTAKTTQTSDGGAVVELGEDWDRDSIITLLEALGRK